MIPKLYQTQKDQTKTKSELINHPTQLNPHHHPVTRPRHTALYNTNTPSE